MHRCSTLISLTIGFCTLAQSVHATDSSVPFINADGLSPLMITGRGITVAVIDTGVDFSQAGLSDNLTFGMSFENGPVPDGGANVHGDPHGTIVSLIVADSSGVAPDARIMPITVLEIPRVSTPTNVRWCIMLRYCGSWSNQLQEVLSCLVV